MDLFKPSHRNFLPFHDQELIDMPYLIIRSEIDAKTSASVSLKH